MLVVAIFALRHPNDRAAVAGKTTGTPSPLTTQSAGSPPSAGASSTPSKTAAPSASSSASPPGRPSSSATGSASEVPLVVLNNTTVTGLAERAAQRFSAGGWTVTSFGNYQNDILSTCAYYDPDAPGAREAALALQKQFPTIKRVQPKFPQLPAGPIVVVLTPDYS